MGLNRCTECETIEGYWGFIEIEGDEIDLCKECGGVDCKETIPEHDDNEER